MTDPHVIPIDVILSQALAIDSREQTATHSLVQQADVIYAIENETNLPILVYGKEKLQRIAHSDLPEGARVLRVGVDSSRRNLDRLLQLVKKTKGSIDYAEPA